MTLLVYQPTLLMPSHMAISESNVIEDSAITRDAALLLQKPDCHVHHTGVLAITAARMGAKVTGLDLTPELIEQARENAAIARVPEIVWDQGDVEALPHADASFNVVVSQFGHMFAPRPEVTVAEMRQVLKSGG